MGELCRLLSLLEELKLNLSLEDGWEWAIFNKNKFTSKSLYLELVSIGFPSFPHEGI